MLEQIRKPVKVPVNQIKGFKPWTQTAIQAAGLPPSSLRAAKRRAAKERQNKNYWGVD